MGHVRRLRHLIDWEKGIIDAFEKEATRRLHARPRLVVPLFHEVSHEIEGGSYELYAEVLRRTALEIAKRHRTGRSSPRARVLPDRCALAGFNEANPQLKKFTRTRIGLISNVDDKLLGQTRATPAGLRPRRHRPAGPLLQARPRALQGVRAPHRRQEGLGHVASATTTTRAVPKEKVPSIWVNRRRRGAGGREEPTAEVKTLAEAAKLLGVLAPCGSSPSTPDVLVATQRCGRRRARRARRRRASSSTRRSSPTSSRRCPSSSRRASPLSGLLATHGDWDHLLGRNAFPDAALGVAETTAARLSAEPGDAAARLRAFDAERLRERERPLTLGQRAGAARARPLELGEARSSSCTRPTATRPTAWRSGLRGGVLVCGDYLSPVELPMLSDGGSRDAYLATLERLAPLVEQADAVVPGHGEVLDGAARAGDPARGRRLPAGAARRRAAARAPGRAAARDPRAQRRARCDPPRRPGDPRVADLEACSPSGAAGLRAGRGAAVAARARDWSSATAADPLPARRRPRRAAARPRRRRRRATTSRRSPAPRRRLRARPAREHWGSPRCFVRDPAGHVVEVMAFRPLPERGPPRRRPAAQSC